MRGALPLPLAPFGEWVRAGLRGGLSGGLEVGTGALATVGMAGVGTRVRVGVGVGVGVIGALAIGGKGGDEILDVFG